jgi:hypothetical protein
MRRVRRTVAWKALGGQGRARHAGRGHGYSPVVRPYSGLRIAGNGHPARVCHGKVGLVIGMSIAFAGNRSPKRLPVHARGRVAQDRRKLTTFKDP